MVHVRQKLEKMVSPKGVAVWPKLTGQPDTKFKDAGDWKVTLRLEDKDPINQRFIASLEQRHAASVEAAKKEVKAGKKIKVADAPWKAEVDEEGVETGCTLVNFKMSASGTRDDGSKWTATPMIVDSKGTELKGVSLGGGSVIRVSFKVSPFYVPALGAGLSLRMNGVQVLSLVEGGKMDAKSLGFQDEDGYTFEAPAAENANADSAEDATTDEDDEFAL